MSTYQEGHNAGYAASADYSTTGIFRFMTINTSNQLVLATVRGQYCDGVLQDKPSAAGRPGTLRTAATTKAYAGEAVAVGEAITNDANGAAVVGDLAGDYIHGRCVSAAASGSICEVALKQEGRLNDGRAWSEILSGHGTADEYATIALVGTVASGTADAANLCYTPGGNTFNWEPWGTQTLLAPAASATGMDIAFDQTADDGVEFNSNYLGATGTAPFVVGNSPAFFFRVKFSIADVSGTDDFHIGFRDAGIARPNVDDYIDMAAIGCTAADGTVDLETIVGGAGTTTTDTTDTILDTVTYQFKVLVSAAGVVTYQHDIATQGTLAAPTTVAALTFADGLPLIPFVRQLQGTDLTGAFVIQEWEVGYS